MCLNMAQEGKFCFLSLSLCKQKHTRFSKPKVHYNLETEYCGSAAMVLLTVWLVSRGSLSICIVSVETTGPKELAPLTYMCSREGQVKRRTPQKNHQSCQRATVRKTTSTSLLQSARPGNRHTKQTHRWHKHNSPLCNFDRYWSKRDVLKRERLT